MMFFSRDNRGNPSSDCVEGNQWEFIHWPPQLIHKQLAVSILCVCVRTVYIIVWHSSQLLLGN